MFQRKDFEKLLEDLDKNQENLHTATIDFEKTRS